jgi:hypothetical protein
MNKITKKMLGCKITFQQAIEMANKLPYRERLKVQRELRFYVAQEQ